MKRKILANLIIVNMIVCIILSTLPVIDIGAGYDFESQNSNTTSLDHDDPDLNRNYGTLEYAGKIVSQGDYLRALVYFDVSSIPSDATVSESKILLMGKLVYSSGTGNVGIYRVNRSWNVGIATWNVRGDPYPQSSWYVEGGDYEPTLLDNISYTQDDLTYKWREFNVTTSIQSFVNGSKANYGFILREVVELNWNCMYFKSDINSDPSSHRPKLVVNYTTPTLSHNITIYKNYWNFKGYPNTTTTSPSTLINEIQDGKAISGKNITTGYWYTYWPSIGLTESWDINFGDGLFILGSANTTWQTYTHTTPTNLTINIWNPAVFSNPTNKNTSDIHSKVEHCSAVISKNDTSGYWYTYWPDYGLLEDEPIEFGDGLFILTSQNTTWDHT